MTGPPTTSRASDPAGDRRDQLDPLDGPVGARGRDEGDLPARACERGDLQRDRRRQPGGARHERAVPAADLGSVRDLVRGDLRLRLRLLPAGAARAFDGLLGEHDEHGRRRLRRARRLRARLRHVHLEGGRLRRPAREEGQPHRDQPLRVRDAQRARRGAGARLPDPHPPLRVHHRLGRCWPAPRRSRRHARLRADARRRDALRPRQPRRRARLGMGRRPGCARQRADPRLGRARRARDRRHALRRPGEKGCCDPLLGGRRRRLARPEDETAGVGARRRRRRPRQPRGGPGRLRVAVRVVDEDAALYEVDENETRATDSVREEAGGRDRAMWTT